VALSGTFFAAYAAHVAARPLERAIEQGLNEAAPTVIPGVAEAIEAYFRGWLTSTEMQNILLWNGVASAVHSGSFPWIDRYASSWRKIIDANRPGCPDQVLKYLYASGRLIGDSLDRQEKHNGLWEPSWRAAWESQIDLPPLHALIEQSRLGTISNADMEAMASFHGSSAKTRLPFHLNSTKPLHPEQAFDLSIRGLMELDRAGQHAAASGLINVDDVRSIVSSAYAKYLPSRDEILRLHRLGIIGDDTRDVWLHRVIGDDGMLKESLLHATRTLGESQVLSLWNRGLLSEGRARLHLRSGNIINDSDRDAIEKSRFAQLPMQEIVALAPRARVCFNYTDLFGPAQQPPADVLDAAEKTGYGNPNVKIDGVQDEYSEVSPAQLSWAAHWSRPNAEDAIVGMFRLTEERCKQLKKVNLNVKPFPVDAIDNLLEASGVAPGFKDYAKALAYLPVPIRMMRVAYTSGKMSHADAVLRLKQNGLLGEDAEIVVSAWDATVAQAALKPVTTFLQEQVKRAIKLALDGYVLGYLTAEQAAITLTQYGIPLAAANQTIVIAEQDRLHAAAVKGLSALQRDFNHGSLTPIQAVNALVVLGITVPMANWHVQQWELQRPLADKHASSGAIKTAIRDGLMTPAQGQLQLVNLGLPIADAHLLVLEAEQLEANLHSREITAAEKVKSLKAKELQAAASKAAATLRRLQSSLRQATPPSTLQRWYRKGVIGKQFFVSRLVAMGYSDDEALALLNDAITKAPEQEEAKHGHPPPEADDVDVFPD
jgi:hypothetical protein